LQIAAQELNVEHLILKQLREAAKAGATAAAPDAKGSEKKGAAAPKAEKKEAEKKK
jgi:hypothetical protein